MTSWTTRRKKRKEQRQKSSRVRGSLPRKTLMSTTRRTYLFVHGVCTVLRAKLSPAHMFKPKKKVTFREWALITCTLQARAPGAKMKRQVKATLKKVEDWECRSS